MAAAHGSGFDQRIRVFTDNSINAASIDKVTYAYCVEVVNCDPTTEVITPTVRVDATACATCRGGRGVV